MKPTSFLIFFSLVVIICLLKNVEQTHGFRTYLIVGESKVGKSTIGNCILSEGLSINDIKNVPFNTRETTTEIKASGNNKTRVIDTFDFVNQKADQSRALKQLRKALAGDNYRVDVVLYVMTFEPLRKETVKFFKLIQQDLFKNVTRNNSILICNGCFEGWLDEERKANTDLNNIIDNCGKLTYNFMINMDEKDLTEEAVTERKHSIEELKRFLDDQNFQKLDLSFMKKGNFQRFFLRKISDYKNHLIVAGIGISLFK